MLLDDEEREVWQSLTQLPRERQPSESAAGDDDIVSCDRSGMLTPATRIVDRGYSTSRARLTKGVRKEGADNGAERRCGRGADGRCGKMGADGEVRTEWCDRECR